MRSPAAPVNRYQPSLQNARSRAEPDCTVPTAGSSDCKSPVTSVYLPTAFVEARHDSESSLTTLKLGQLAWQIMFDYNCIAEPADGARAATRAHCTGQAPQGTSDRKKQARQETSNAAVHWWTHGTRCAEESESGAASVRDANASCRGGCLQRARSHRERALRA